MQPLATDVRVMRRMYRDGTVEGAPGDAVSAFSDGGVFRLFFFPGSQTATVEEAGVSVAEARRTVKAPWCDCFRPGDRLADLDGTMLWEVVAETTYPGHQTMEVRPI